MLMLGATGWRWIVLVFGASLLWGGGWDAEVLSGAGITQSTADVELGPATRVPWTTSRIVGSPDPPLPLVLQPAFPRLQFQDPLQIRWEPSLQRYFLCELGGKIWSFPADETVEVADLVVDFPRQLRSYDPQQSQGVREVYSLALDPEFGENGYIYVCLIFSNATTDPWEHGSRISRFTVSRTEPPTIDVESELPILTWLLGGHNGCDLAFDNSGCLLISTGDATDPSPPDRLRAGQDISNLLASVLRIDVRGATSERPYQIPADNPFRDTSGARPEVWAYGFRNPWRIATDPQSEAVWVGDVGWEKWELIHQVQAGGNYGWSVREGFELIQPTAAVGPTPILPPRVALSHADAASITGGYVYRGQRLSAVADHYLFGDWVNGRVWAVPADRAGDEFPVASGLLRIVALVPDRDGEPLVVNHFAPTTLYRLVANPAVAVTDAVPESLLSSEWGGAAVEQPPSTHEFPRWLSQTGLFSDTPRQVPAPGVVRFEVNQPMWQDGAHARYYLGLPQLSQLTVFDQPQALESVAMFSSRLHFPAGAVLAKTLTWQQQRLETQVLHFDGRLWHGYSYVWNAAGEDAELAPAAGLELDLPAGTGQKWTVHSRTECLQCHNPWAEQALALTPEQLYRAPADGDSQAGVTNDTDRNVDASRDSGVGQFAQEELVPSLDWQGLVTQGFVVTLDGQRRPVPAERVVSRPLGNRAEDLDTSARSYLHVNCGHCHRFGAGTGVALSLKMSDEPVAMQCFGVRPEKGHFELADSRLIKAGDPLQSILLLRMASLTTGRMPHIGSREVDFAGVDLIARWIRQMPTDAAEYLGDLAESPAAGTGAGQAVDSNEVLDAFRLALELAELRSRGLAESALESADLRSRIAAGHPVVSTLLEAFLPLEQRVRRLSPQATYADLGGLNGVVADGQRLFLDRQRLQCGVCHRITGVNAAEPIGIGPDLTGIGARLNRVQLFEAIVDPSRQIAPEYQGLSILRLDGTVVTGLMDQETAEVVVIRTATGERIRVPLDEIDQRQVSPQSLMPSGLAQQLSAQEMADLIEFLADQLPTD